MFAVNTYLPDRTDAAYEAVGVWSRPGKANDESAEYVSPPSLRGTRVLVLYYNVSDGIDGYAYASITDRMARMVMPFVGRCQFGNLDRCSD